MPACAPTYPLLEVRDLSVSYGEGYRPVLSGLNFDIGAGEVLGLQGRSGAGKTSTALAILGLLPFGARVSGSVLFRENQLRNHDLLKLPVRELRKIRGKQISIIYQEPALALNPVMRVGDQIAEIARAHSSRNSRQCLERAQQLLCRVGLKESRFYRSYSHELSGGERHRVVLAQALVCQPSLVIADEPTAGLDDELKREILDLIESIRHEFGTAFLLISHDRSVCSRLVDRAIELPRYDQTSGEAPLHTRHAAPLVTNARELAQVRSSSSAVKNGSAFFASPNDAYRETPLIRIRGLSKWYRGRGVFSSKHAEKHALDCIDLNIAAGSILGLVGPSGSGKSTLARCLSLLEPGDTGELLFEETNLLRLSHRELRRYRPLLQYIAQDPAAALNPRLSAADAVAEPMLIQGSHHAAERLRRVEELMPCVGLDPAAAQRPCHQFSGGQKQRLAIARALTLNPKLLILDESLSGLDVETRDGITDLLKQLKHILGITQVVISHDLDLVASIADGVAVMRNGRIVERTNNRLFDERWATRQMIASAPRRDLVTQEVE